MKQVTPDDRLVDTEFDAEMARRPWAKKVSSAITHILQSLKHALELKKW